MNHRPLSCDATVWSRILDCEFRTRQVTVRSGNPTLNPQILMLEACAVGAASWSASIRGNFPRLASLDFNGREFFSRLLS